MSNSPSPSLQILKNNILVSISPTLSDIKRTVRLRTGHKDPEGTSRIALLFLHLLALLFLPSAPHGGWVVNATPRTLYPGTHRTEEWVVLSTSL